MHKMRKRYDCTNELEEKLIAGKIRE